MAAHMMPQSTSPSRRQKRSSFSVFQKGFPLIKLAGLDAFEPVPHDGQQDRVRASRCKLSQRFAPELASVPQLLGSHQLPVGSRLTRNAKEFWRR